MKEKAIALFTAAIFILAFVLAGYMDQLSLAVGALH